MKFNCSMQIEYEHTCSLLGVLGDLLVPVVTVPPRCAVIDK